MGDSSPYLYVSGNDLVDHWRLMVQEKEREQRKEVPFIQQSFSVHTHQVLFCMQVIEH